MEPILVELPQNGSSFEVAPHSGEEFGYVIEGCVSLICGEKKIYSTQRRNILFKR